MNENDYVSRQEHDAKLSASESRIEAKLTEYKADADKRFSAIDARFSAIDARLDMLTASVNLLVADRLSSKLSSWGIFAAILLGFAGVIASLLLK